MTLELSEEQRKVLLHALEVYLSDLREEIVKAENVNWKEGLHNEKNVLNQVLAKLS